MTGESYDENVVQMKGERVAKERERVSERREMRESWDRDDDDDANG